jgi:hypothetical protein
LNNSITGSQLELDINEDTEYIIISIDNVSSPSPASTTSATSLTARKKTSIEKSGLLKVAKILSTPKRKEMKKWHFVVVWRHLFGVSNLRRKR